MSEYILQLNDINQYYGESHTLRDFVLQVPQGKCTVLMGRNGVGKTTLLQCIMGLVPIRSGEIIYNGQNIENIAVDRRAPIGIGYVPQGRQIFPLLTVEENLRIALSARADRARDIPPSIYELFPVLKQMRSRRGGDLSGGQQQQLAIGRALVTDPKLLVLDEPTEGIQPNIVAEIGDILKSLCADAATGLSVLLVEQKLPFARKIADSFCLMNRGEAVAKGEIDQLNDSLVEQYLTV